MTNAESLLQHAVDHEGERWVTLSILADLLEEQGDPTSVGWREIVALKRWPNEEHSCHNEWDWFELGVDDDTYSYTVEKSVFKELMGKPYREIFPDARVGVPLWYTYPSPQAALTDLADFLEEQGNDLAFRIRVLSHNPYWPVQRYNGAWAWRGCSYARNLKNSVCNFSCVESTSGTTSQRLQGDLGGDDSSFRLYPTWQEAITDLYRILTEKSP